MSAAPPTPSQIAALQALAASLGAPPGTIPNYVDPPSIGDEIKIPSIVLIVLTTLFVCARLACKTFTTKALAWDDFWSVSALLCAIARCTISVILVDRYNLGRHLWDINPLIPGIYDNIRNLQWIEDMVYLLGILCAKVSILVLYVNIFRPNKKFRLLCYIMMVATAIYCTIFIFLYAFNCEPQYYTWHVVLNAPATCIEITYVIMAIGGFNLLTDLIILIMPIPLIVKLNLRRRQKWGLVAVFMTGLFIVATTIARLVIVVDTVREVDQSWEVVPEVIWLTVELDMGIICGCLPACAPLYTRVLSRQLLPTSLRNFLSRSFGSSNASRRGYTQSKDNLSKTQFQNDPLHKGSTSTHDSDVQLVRLDPVEGYVNTKVVSTGNVPNAYTEQLPPGNIGMQYTVEQDSRPRGKNDMV